MYAVPASNSMPLSKAVASCKYRGVAYREPRCRRQLKTKPSRIKSRTTSHHDSILLSQLLTSKRARCARRTVLCMNKIGATGQSLIDSLKTAEQNTSCEACSAVDTTPPLCPRRQEWWGRIRSTAHNVTTSKKVGGTTRHGRGQNYRPVTRFFEW